MVVIGVIGSSKSDEVLDGVAYEVGRLVAQMGAVLVCGGLGGVMQSACRGAKDGGGLTVGILPSDRRGDANPYVDVAIATGMGLARNAIIARTADVLIAVGGGYGTLSEIGHGLNMGKDVVSVGSWDVLRGNERFHAALGPAEAVDRAFELLGRRADRPMDRLI